MFARRAIQEQGVPSSGDLTLTLPISRNDIANFIGLTIETTSRQFTQLKRDKVIDLPSQRDVYIRDLARLFREAGELD